MRGTTRREAVEVFRRRGAGPVVHRPALHDTAKRALRWKQETSTLSIGIDIAKSEHWATALDRDGQKIHDKALPGDKARLRDLYERLNCKRHLLVVVDQPATIETPALAVTVAAPGTWASQWATCRARPGRAKTDKRDAAIIAQTAATMPHTLRTINTSEEGTAALSMLTGFDLDLARQVNQAEGHIRGQCTPQTRPALEAVLGPRLAHDAALETIAARRRPHRTEEGRQGTHRCQAEQARSPPPCRLGPADLRCPGQADRDGGRH